MASKFKIGDLVWAKMKGFPAWPGKVIEPKSDVKKPADRKRKQFVFFFGSENYAWIPEEAVHRYVDHKDKFETISRVPRGFKEAVNAIEDALLANPDQAVKTKDLPTIDDELAQIFPSSKDDKVNQKDYSRRGKKRSDSTDSAGSTPRASRSSAVGTVNSTRSSKQIPQEARSARAGAGKLDAPKSASHTSGIKGGKGKAKCAPAAVAGKSNEKRDRKVDGKRHDKIKGFTGIKLATREEKRGKLAEWQKQRPGEPGPDRIVTRRMRKTFLYSEQTTKEQMARTCTTRSALSSKASPLKLMGRRLRSDQRRSRQGKGKVVTKGKPSSPGVRSATKLQGQSPLTFADKEPALIEPAEDLTTVLPCSSETGNQLTLKSSEKHTAEADGGLSDEDIFRDEEPSSSLSLVTETSPPVEEPEPPQEEPQPPEEEKQSAETQEPPVKKVRQRASVSAHVVLISRSSSQPCSSLNPPAASCSEAAQDLLQIVESETKNTIPLRLFCYRKSSLGHGPLAEGEQSLQGDETLPNFCESYNGVGTSDLPLRETDLFAAEPDTVEGLPFLEACDLTARDIIPQQGQHCFRLFHISKKTSSTETPFEVQSTELAEGGEPSSSAVTGSRLADKAKDKEKEEPTPRAKSDKKKDSRTSLAKPLKKRALSPASSTPPPPKKGKALVKHMTSDSGLEPKSMVTTSESRAMQREIDEYACRDPFLDPDYSPALAAPAPPKNVIATPMKIGFLGLGIMGTGMVNNLLISGHEVTVWNRTPSKCREFVKEGALKANSPAEVVQTCDITFSCVSDPAALKDLVFGNCGVLQGIEQGKAFVDMSTVDVETIQDINEAVTARGGRFLEAPVIGSRQPSVDGSLVVLTAGDRSLHDDCYSCFEAMGRKTFYLGEVGSATKMKLVTTMLMGTVLAGLSESLALAEKVGLDQDDVMSILQMSPVSCNYIKEKGNAMLSSLYNDPHCKLQVYQKDLRLAVNMSDSVDQPLHVGSAVNELFKKAKAKGYGEHDTAAVYRAAAL